MDYTTKPAINKVLNSLNQQEVEKIIKDNCDRYVKKLITNQFIKLFVNAHLREHNGVRDISVDLSFNERL